MAEPLIRLEPIARDYAWGSRTLIPTLMGQPRSDVPVAELWFGAHPDSPSTTERGRLDELIAADPIGELGPDVAAEFGARLPFLLKLLAAKHALSIQVHPTLAQARAGFAAEQAQGLPADAPNRNYRDANHKPELLCALTEFDALCGFRPIAATLELFDALDVVSLGPVRSRLQGPDPLRSALRWLLELDAPGRDAVLTEVLPACARLAATDRWAREAHAALQAARDFPGDVGAVIALLLNAVRLRPGEAIFLGAGTVHAYLRGLGVELMANSDNVVRCGLTPKHIDVAEVMRIADFTALEQPRLTPLRAGTTGRLTFAVPVPDFELSIIDGPGQTTPLELRGRGPQILLCTEGAVEVDGRELGPGQAVFAAAGSSALLSGCGRVFRATTGAAQAPAMS